MTDYSNQNITNTNLTGVNLSGANFTNTIATGVNFTNANITNATFSNTLITSANISTLTFSSIQKGQLLLRAANIGISAINNLTSLTISQFRRIQPAISLRSLNSIQSVTVSIPNSGGQGYTVSVTPVITQLVCIFVAVNQNIIISTSGATVKTIRSNGTVVQDVDNANATLSFLKVGTIMYKLSVGNGNGVIAMIPLDMNLIQVNGVGISDFISVNPGPTGPIGPTGPTGSTGPAGVNSITSVSSSDNTITTTTTSGAVNLSIPVTLRTAVVFVSRMSWTGQTSQTLPVMDLINYDYEMIVEIQNVALNAWIYVYWNGGSTGTFIGDMIYPANINTYASGTDIQVPYWMNNSTTTYFINVGSNVQSGANRSVINRYRLQGLSSTRFALNIIGRQQLYWSDNNTITNIGMPSGGTYLSSSVWYNGSNNANWAPTAITFNGQGGSAPVIVTWLRINKVSSA